MFISERGKNLELSLKPLLNFVSADINIVSFLVLTIVKFIQNLPIISVLLAPVEEEKDFLGLPKVSFYG